MRSGFFNDTDVYAEDFARFAAGILTNGVLAKTGDELLVTAYEGMSVSVAPGYCWIEGHFGLAGDSEVVNIEPADGTYARIDRIVARLDRSTNSLSLQVITGTPAVSPAAPEIVRDGTYFDLGLATISIPVGALEITSEMITDTREDNTICGGVFPQRSSAFIESDPPYNPAIFPDRNLNVVFADEISQFSSVWAWIGNRFATKNLADIYLSDYFVFEYDNKTWHARLQDMYVPCGDDTQTAWGDFMCDELLDPMYIMGDPSVTSPAAYNNGAYNSLGSIMQPWRVSHVYFYLNSLSGIKYTGKTTSGHSYTFAEKDYSDQGVWYNFPQEAKNVIVDKTLYIPTKKPETLNSGKVYNDEESSAVDVTGMSLHSLGKLWIPSWYEIIGEKTSHNYDVSSPTYVYYMSQDYSNWATNFSFLNIYNANKRPWLTRIDGSFLFKLIKEENDTKIWLLDPANHKLDEWYAFRITTSKKVYAGSYKTNDSTVYVPLCFRIGVPTT